MQQELTNYQKSFERLMDETFIKVNGCLVEKCGSGFIILGKKVSSMAEVKKEIESAKKYLKNSIKKHEQRNSKNGP